MLPGPSPRQCTLIHLPREADKDVLEARMDGADTQYLDVRLEQTLAQDVHHHRTACRGGERGELVRTPRLGWQVFDADVEHLPEHAYIGNVWRIPQDSERRHQGLADDLQAPIGAGDLLPLHRVGIAAHQSRPI